MSEAEEVRFLKHILEVLKKHRLAPGLFPELKGRGDPEAYYVCFKQNMPQIAEDIILEFFKLYDERRSSGDAEEVGGAV